MANKHNRIHWLVAVLGSTTIPFLCGADWPQFRGTDNSSISSDKEMPVEWKAEDAAWSIALKGRCVSGPIVVDGTVITTSSGGTRNERLHIWAVDAKSGQLKWHRQLWGTGRTYCHPLSSMASPTPASDGRYLYVHFASNDLVCLDLDGNVQWMRAFGVEFPKVFDDRGMGASPAIVGDTVVVQLECKGDSAVLGIDATNGSTRWRHTLSRNANWCSPTAFPSSTGELVLVQAMDELLVVESKSGEIRQRYSTPGSGIPSAAVAGDTILLPSKGLTALRYVAGKDVELVWQQNRLGPQRSSPIFADGKVYVLRAGILVCGQASDGKLLWRERLAQKTYWATPVLAGNLLYVVDAEGLVQVIDVSGDTPEVLARNAMGEEMLGSPAISDGAIFLRGVEHLWKIQR